MSFHSVGVPSFTGPPQVHTHTHTCKRHFLPIAFAQSIFLRSPSLFFLSIIFHLSPHAFRTLGPCKHAVFLIGLGLWFSPIVFRVLCLLGFLYGRVLWVSSFGTEVVVGMWIFDAKWLLCCPPPPKHAIAVLSFLHACWLEGFMLRCFMGIFAVNAAVWLRTLFVWGFLAPHASSLSPSDRSWFAEFS